MLPFLSLLEILLKQISDESKTSFNLTFDSLNHMPFADRDLTNLRRTIFKLGVKPELKFCQPQMEVSNKLLGDNISEKVKTVRKPDHLGYQAL